MKPDKIKALAIEALKDLKGTSLTTIDVRGITSITDFMIICTGRSTRHVKSLADSVVKSAKSHKLTYIKMEGEKEGEWVLVDLADVVVHIMLPATREFYNLEGLWDHAHSDTGHRE